MSSTDDTFPEGGSSSPASSPYDEPTQAIEKVRVRRPKPDNDDFFDRHGRKPAPEVRTVIDAKAARDDAGDQADDAATEALPVAETAELSAADEGQLSDHEASTNTGSNKTGSIIKAEPLPTENPVKKSVSDEPVRTEPFVDDDNSAIADADSDDDEAAQRRRYAEHLTEPPLPYIEPQPTTPLEFENDYTEELPTHLPEAAEPAVVSESGPEVVPVRRGTLDLGLLILRVVVGLTFTLHGLQKLTGWMNGPGQNGFADYLANKPNPAIGFHDNVTTILSLAAGITETAGGILLILGLLTPIAGAALLGTILVALTYKATLAGGLWFFNADGGGNGLELEILLAAAAIALILTGPGTYSVDRRWGWSRRPAWGSAAWVIVGIGAAVAVWMIFNGSNPLQATGHFIP
ncbi:MAG: DoxX family protein [Gordonia sp. (in: high G+C Gram-positive bacteria)]|uniref:DoxX family protein n=1 Tax=Gordonia sp. (in: high G+C Gram-positive bacteria) TaxID=84139 RepID=UPI003C75F352